MVPACVCAPSFIGVLRLYYVTAYRAWMDGWMDGWFARDVVDYDYTVNDKGCARAVESACTPLFVRRSMWMRDVGGYGGRRRRARVVVGWKTDG